MEILEDFLGSNGESFGLLDFETAWSLFIAFGLSAEE